MQRQKPPALIKTDALELTIQHDGEFWLGYASGLDLGGVKAEWREFLRIAEAILEIELERVAPGKVAQIKRDLGLH